MQQSDIAKLLTAYGFRNPLLVKMETNNYTYKFDSYDYKKLLNTFGTPSVAGGGKVAVFQVPSVGKLGVSPSSNMVRVIYSGSHSSLSVRDTHLGQKATTPELALLYERAKTSPQSRVSFATKLWEYFNETKFAGRLPKPKILVSAKPPIKSALLGKTPRGCYIHDANFGPGTLWLADFLFNAREAFFNEIMLHEQCHQAVACLDRSRDLEEGGHGPKWKAWMKKVGLDPRRYDPTDNYVYKDAAAGAMEEEKLTRDYGPRQKLSYFKSLTKVDQVYGREVIWEYRGRALTGVFKKVGRKIRFDGHAAGNKRVSFVMGVYPAEVYQ